MTGRGPERTRVRSWYHAPHVRAAFAPIRAVIVGLVAISLAAYACAAPEPKTPVGMSDSVPERGSPAPVAATPRAPWPDFVAARAWPEGAPPSVALGHRRDGTLVHVRVEPSALAAYRELSAESGMPEGARVVAWHEASGGVLLGGYLLEKRGGSWSALEIDGKGALVPGDHASCVRCHDMAPTDHLFGIRAAEPTTPPIGGESIDPQRR